MKKSGFTLMEILTVIAIISILAAILVPATAKARKMALQRRAEAEMGSIKVAVLQFQADHRYMPWPDTVKVGDDKWATDAGAQMKVMDLLTGNNPMKKSYLQIPEKSRPKDKSLLFLDPWSPKEGSYRFYVIGMDRNLDGAVLVANTAPAWNGKTVAERVLVYSPGDPAASPANPLKTFDVVE